MDDGGAILMSVKKEYKYYKHEEVKMLRQIFNIKLHVGRVMGIQIHNGLLYTISEDKHFKVTNIDT